MKITKPTLLIDRKKSLANISEMAKKAIDSNVNFRPHFKTHFSAEIGNWFRDFGVESCTVSSVEMASYFIANGWKDVTIAFPFNPLEATTISELASKAHINVLIESEESLTLANELLSKSVGYFIKVDIGTHRTGVDPNNQSLIEKLVEGSTEKIKFKGFLAHAGHTYGQSEEIEINSIFNKSVEVLTSLQSKFGGLVSYGDTPSCSVLNDFSAVDEIRPGNFIFYDWMQHQIGSCQMENIAVCMACPVVAIHSDRDEAVIYGGGVHFSKDRVLEGEDPCFGKAVNLKEGVWDTQVIGSVKKLSQEHGIITMTSEKLSQMKVGHLIGVIPVHSCLAADLQGHYLTTTGDRIEKMAKD